MQPTQITVVIHRPDLHPEQVNAITRTGGTLSRHESHWRWCPDTPPEHQQLEALRGNLDCDVNLLPPGFDSTAVRLLLMDMDSTLIAVECIDELADRAGCRSQVAAITEASMRGELNFAEGLNARVQLLAGLARAELEYVYKDRVRLNPGAQLLLEGLRKRGIKIGLVSGGFTFFTERLARELSLDYSHANVLEFDGDQLTGKVLGPIVGSAEKAQFLEACCRELGVSTSEACAIGDGANDIPMLRVAVLGIAFHGKPVVRQAADVSIDRGDLSKVLDFL